MSDVILGTQPAEDALRDAFHVAVAPVVAAHGLDPGDHVFLTKDGTADRPSTATELNQCVGIVDPFLRGRVEQGRRFWLCLYQKTVTGMRHEWSHPAFSPSGSPIVVRTNGLTEAQLAARRSEYSEYNSRISADDLIEYATYHADDPNTDEYLNAGGTLESVSTSDEFWEKFKILTGKTGTGNFFTCSC